MADGRHTEYGGGPGAVGRFPNGSGKELSASEKARILRQIGMHGSTISENTLAAGVDAAGDPEPAARTEARKRLEERTNGYWRDPQVGE